MTFDWTISLGNLIAIGGFSLGGIVFVLTMRADLLVLGTRVGAVETAMRDLARSQITVAGAISKLEALDERMNQISRRLDDHITASTQRI